MNFKFGKKTVLLWQLRVMAAAIIVSLLFLLLARYSLYFLIPSGVFITFGFAVILWYLPAYFSKYSIFVGESAVIVTKGVYIETSHIMPFKRLVFAGGYSTPLARIMHLKGVTLRAARASIIIPEIEEKDANELIFGIGGEKKDD